MATITPPSETSVLGSAVRGTVDAVKGLFSGGIAGGILGAAIGGAIAIFTGELAVIATGAAIGGAAMASLGTAAGFMTGVIKSRETNKVAFNDAIKASNVALVQGIGLGKQAAVAEMQWVNMLSQEQTNPAQGKAKS